MLRTALAFCLLAVLALSPLAVQSAQAYEPDGELGLLVGAARADNGLTGGDDKVGALFGLRAASRFRYNWNWFIDGVYSSYDRTLTTDALELFEARTGLEYLFGHGASGSHWFFAGALGVADIDQPAGFNDQDRTLLSLGFGWAQLTRSGGPRIELRGEHLFGDGEDFSNLQLVLGWSLGLNARAEEPARDSDGDGVNDRDDDCANTPRGARVDSRGCPKDSDGDGVYDGLDKCPDTPRGAVVDARGCPVDSDKDGVYDGLDKCPGTPAGTKVDANGCPERKTMFEPGKKTLVLEGVNFAIDSAELTPESGETLDRVVSELKEWPEVRVEIGGHTDWTGEDAYNMDLSHRRSESVRAYLVSKGISASRLEARGYGETRPVASNETAAGRTKNRRVELKKLD